jgi:plastocyanin
MRPAIGSGALLMLLAVASGCGDCADSCSPPIFDLSMNVPLDQSVIRDLAITSAAVVTVGPGGGNSFSPATVTIHATESVTWNWVTGLHSVVSDSAPKAFPDSPTQSAGQYTVTFMTAGTYPYHCGVHGTMMTGTVVVQ